MAVEYGAILSITLSPKLSKAWALPRKYLTPEQAKMSVALIGIHSAMDFLDKFASQAQAARPQITSLDAFTSSIALPKFNENVQRPPFETLLIKVRRAGAEIWPEDISMPIGPSK